MFTTLYYTVIQIYANYGSLSFTKGIMTFPNSKVHGPNLGPTWVLSAPDEPHAGPMNLAIRVGIAYIPLNYIQIYYIPHTTTGTESYFKQTTVHMEKTQRKKKSGEQFITWEIKEKTWITYIIPRLPYVWYLGSLFNKKMQSSQYRDSHYKAKTAHNSHVYIMGIPRPRKTVLILKQGPACQTRRNTYLKRKRDILKRGNKISIDFRITEEYRK